MISFDALPGNRSLKASLRRALAGRVPQTILLSGDDSRSLETLSTALAAGILCEADGPRPCSACLSCRKVQDGVHPDLTLIDEGEDELKVDLARRIKAENAIIPNDGARRVTVIRHAHNMNAYAQNALLKELEEPPHFAFFILTSESRTRFCRPCAAAARASRSSRPGRSRPSPTTRRPGCLCPI